MKKLFDQAAYWSGVVVLGLVLGLSIQFVRAWTEPTDAPPNGNVGAPINTGPFGQFKQGVLQVLGLTIYNDPAVTGVDVTGRVLKSQNAYGKIGWGDGGGSGEYAVIEDQKPMGTGGGAIGNNVKKWMKRDLNTETFDSANIVSLSGNKFTLQPGNYRIRAEVPGFNVAGFRARLYNATDNKDVSGCLGTSEGNSSSYAIDKAYSTIVCEISLVETKSFQIEFFGQGNSGCSTHCLGMPMCTWSGGCGSDYGDYPEIYTRVEIWKVN
jgi:hypothetical protein